MATDPKPTNTDQVARDLQNWDVIRNHRTGSPGDHVTSSWLAQEIVSAGAVPELDALTLERRLPGATRVSDGTHSIDGLPCFDGPLDDGKPVRGRAGPADSDAPIRVVPFVPIGDPALERLREQGACRAVVAVSAAPVGLAPGLAVQNAERFTRPFGPPVLQVSSTASDWLLAAASGGATLEVEVGLDQEPATATNVQTALPGADADLPPVVVMTPKSGWWTCTAERGGGICAWLACIRHFARNGNRRTLIFTANTGHELGHIGLDHYAEEFPDLYRSAHAWVHLGANFAARGSQIRWQASSDAWLERGRRDLEPLSTGGLVVTPVGTRPFGEARNVFDAGGAYVSLLGSNRWFHNPDDRWPNTVDLDATAGMVSFVLETVAELANG